MVAIDTLELSGPRGRYKTTNKYLVGIVDQRSQADRGNGDLGRYHHSDKAPAAGKGSPHAHKGLLWAKAEVGGWAGLELPSDPWAAGPCPAVPWAGPGTFEAILTKALELIFARRHARGTIPAGLALARGAVIALAHTLAAQEAVGEVQSLAIHRHLWVPGHQGTYGVWKPGCASRVGM